MKKNKFGLFALVVGAAGFLACIPGGEVSYVPNELLNQNVEFLVVLPGTSRSRSEKEIQASQDNFLANLASLIGRDNFTYEGSLDAINVVKIKANESYQSIIESINGVQKVAINQTYRFSEVSIHKKTEA